MTVVVLGGAQTDFARNASRDGLGIAELMNAAIEPALVDAGVAPTDLQTAHVGNFTGELFAHQGHLGGLVASLDPAWHGMPCARHEAACASGSVAVLAAAADIEAGRYDVALVVGVELMRNVSGAEAAAHLGVAAWHGREGEDARYLWPHMFSLLAEEYDRRYGLRYEHLMAIARKNFEAARRNPLAQTRAWSFDDAAFSTDDVLNPAVEGRIRRQDCAQITDGAAAVVLASEEWAAAHARRRGRAADDVTRILGWGHRTGTMRMQDKLDRASDGELLFPHLAAAIADARRRAGVELGEVSAFEVHDCFTITEYMLIEHLGLTAPGQAWRAVEDGRVLAGGASPVNPSGGLIGGGHPVGATGVRMVLDAHRQVTGRADGTQVVGARTVQTVNIGGSATTVVSFVIGR